MQTKNAFNFSTLNTVQDFEKHLTTNNNRRIVFSAPFGAGKSYFLEKFFESSERKYNTITISPTHYPVASNEDIFELIKYDLIDQISSRFESVIDRIDIKDNPLISNDAQHSEIEESLYTTMLMAHSYVQDQVSLYQLLKPLAKLIPSGDTALEIVDNFTDAAEKFKKHREELMKKSSDTLIQFAGNIRLKPGSIRESDNVSVLIARLIEILSQLEKGRETVLIVEDLDRLDPEHVFRIINIFTAHHNAQTEENKFGFSRVIFVCDLKNIRAMFAHRYGPAVDFKGYIAKFFSLRPYYFDISELVKSVVENVLIENKNPEIESFSRAITHPLATYSFDRNRYFFNILTFLIEALLVERHLNIRNIEKLPSFEVAEYRFTYLDSQIRYSSTYPILILLDYVKLILPSETDLLVIAKEMSKNFQSVYSAYRRFPEDYSLGLKIIEYCLPFILSRDELAIFDGGSLSVASFQTVNEHGDRIDLAVTYEGRSEYSVKYVTPSIDSSPQIISERPNYWYFIYQALTSKKLIKIQ